MQISMPENVKKIIEKLEAAGFEAYAVGGCVRDSILGRQPNDWDITTSAKPLEIKALFRRTVDTGLQHGTVTVLLGGEGYEVTTYRIDGEYEDSRHPKEVIFTSNLTEDLRRRDFTINAMAYSERGGLVDVFDGMGDIEKGVIRCVGNAEERFTEDALRMLRAVRFSAQLGFSIEESTREAIVKLAGNLSKISAERIQAEMTKLLTSPHPEELKTAYETGITAVILPEFDRIMGTEQHTLHHFCTVGEHTLCALTNIRPDKVLRLAMLFHDMGKPAVRTTDEEGQDHFIGHPEESVRAANEVLHRWKFDNDTINKVKCLVRFHDLRPALTPRSVRRMTHKVGGGMLPLLLEVQRADILAQSGYRREEKLHSLEMVGGLYREVMEKGQCLSIKELAVSGRDLIADGMEPGKEIGRVLEALLDDVLEEPEHNTKEYLLAYSRELKNQT
ncbi:CCA tRNA nucleotidyltransferase [Lachnospiraceae bacterium 46-15]